VVIHTPDQRVRIFVSSTMQELAAERLAVREAIEGLRLTPVMFELGARPYPPRALYRAYLEQSDIFVGLYWESYGWVAPGEDVSGLEDEYRLSGDRPKLIHVKRPAPNQLDADLRAALGDRYEQVIGQARTVDLDRAIAELVKSDPTAQQLSKAGRQETG
jgi:Domain of unknown function (DUF4062)